jgi:hypothetical protein
MEKTYTLSGSKTINFVAEFTEKEMIEAGYDCPREYAHDLDIWVRAFVREGDPSIEIYDIDIEGGV